MKMVSFVYNEVCKVRRSTVFRVVLGVFTALPLMVGFFSSSGPDWESYFSDLSGSLASLLVVGFSFTSAWVFGREYTDNTIKDLLVKPISKWYSVLSKFIVIAMWNVLLAVFTFAVVVVAGLLIGVSGGSISLMLHMFWAFLAASLLIMTVSTTSAFFANVTRGYLAPIGLTFVLVLVSNVVMQLGMGPYFPWTIPVLFLTGAEIGFVSLMILAAAGVAGFTGTVAWWRFAEQG